MFVHFCFLIEKVFAFFVRRCHNRLIRRASHNDNNQNEQCLSTDEPNLEEFNVMVEERVRKDPIAYAREILIDNPSFLLLGRRRDSI